VLQADQSTIKEEQHKVRVDIAPGTPEGTKITFARQGDHGIKKIPSTLL
jgi:DnaJ-class molecular chaperone